MVDYAKDSCFPKEWVVSILLENKTVSDAGDSQIWQLPDHRDSWCRTVQARAAGTSFDRSAFPQAFAHMERHKRKELSSTLMCQPAASGPQHAPGPAGAAGCSGRRRWLVGCVPLCTSSPSPKQHTEEDTEGQAKDFSFQVMKAERHGQS